MSAPDWNREGLRWPHREASRFVEAAGLRWHVQQMGSGPAILLVHGTGASTHSWRDMMEPLAQVFTVVAPDLPGHGFTRGYLRNGPTLPHIASAIGRLLESLGMRPALIVGHSAGSAVALELARESGAPVVGFSPALMPFPGLAARLFPAMAKLLFLNPFVPSIFARMARRPGETERFIARATNSRIDAAGLRCYAALLGNSEHCAGALAMMANWDLEALRSRLPGIRVPVVLAHGTTDDAIPLDAVEAACRLLQDCRLERFERLGHLAHEEAPGQAVDLILRFAAERAILASEGA